MSLLCIPSPLSRVFFITSLFIALATSAALKNITIALPEGTTDHGSPGQLCFPTGWSDLFTFYLGNYIAHAVTVKFLPGEKVKDMIPTVVISLLFPAFGAFRGIMNCLSGASFPKKGPFEMAVRARALCMVIRGANWTPAAGDEVKDVVIGHNQKEKGEGIRNEQALDGDIAICVYSTPWTWSTIMGELPASGREIYGNPGVPEGYDLVIVPRDAEVKPSPDSSVEDPLFTNRGGIKAMFAVIQSLFGILTLYQTKGNQIAMFGSASFGLTVIPYLLMSLLNILSGVFCPEYPSLFLVDSSILQEARKRDGAKLDSTVGLLVEEVDGVFQVGPGANSISALEKSFIFQYQIESISDSTEKEDFQIITEFTNDEDQDSEEKGKLVGDVMQKVFPEIQVARILPQQEQDSRSLKIAMKDTTGSTEAPNVPNLTAYIPSCRPYCRDPSVASSRVAYTLLGIETKSRASGVNVGCTVSQFTSFLKSELQPAGITNSSPRNTILGIYAFFLSFMVGVVSIIIIAALSHFDPAQSTHAQRVWTMTWLCFGCFLGPFHVIKYGETPFYLMLSTNSGLKLKKALKIISHIIKPIGVLIYAAPAIGGLVVVGQMIWVYGNCDQVG